MVRHVCLDHDALDAAAVERARASVTAGGERSDRAPSGNTGPISPSPVSWDHRTIGLHWLRVVHPDDERIRLRRYLVSLFGEPDQSNGRWFYSHGERFANGVLILWGSTRASDTSEAGGSVCVDVPGSVIDSIEPAERFEVCKRLAIGGRVTRLDVALDAFSNTRVGLIDAVKASCEIGQLCRARVWEPRIRYANGEVEAYGVNIGRRGKDGSGRYIRVYDKALEQKSGNAGTWERYEVEFTDDPAAEVAIDIFTSDDPERAMWSRVLGAVEFRQVGGANGNLDRRPDADWWARWKAEFDAIPTVCRRPATNLQKHAAWLRETALSTVAWLASRTNHSVTEIVEHLVGRDVRECNGDRTKITMLRQLNAIIAARRMAVAAC